MKSRVYFHDARGTPKGNRLKKIRDLFGRAGLDKAISEGDRVAVKVHWGEPGNVGFVPPPYVRTVVDLVREAGGRPFVTDTNTLYSGMRRDAVSNLSAAAMNGFSFLTLGAPLLVADGLRGRDFREVTLEGPLVDRAKIAAAILDADSLIVLSHVKCHMLFGFGGALKNLGMGCATPAGKQVLHSDLRPRVNPELCHGDGFCVRSCPERCIILVDPPARVGEHPSDPKIANIDSDRCIGCGECTASCPHRAIPIRWKTSADVMQKKTAEYALAAVKDKPGKVGFLNFVIQVTPDCDCCSWNDVPIVPDVGFAASTDPVALDSASVKLVRESPPMPTSRADGSKKDPWRAVYDIDYRFILEHAEKIGLGTREFKLIRLSGQEGSLEHSTF